MTKGPKKNQETKNPEPAKKQSNGKGRPCFVCAGIGASAGGLSALRTLFSQMPPDPGLAFVVVVHLSPEYKSHFSELLQPHCPMPVQQVTETLPIEANHVYVIPPAANLNTIDTHLRLSDLETERWKRSPIDHFLRTLAEAHKELAIGIV
jgi:two-component system, chemotaxis family, CheB/CheR fusion protein